MRHRHNSQINTTPLTCLYTRRCWRDSKAWLMRGLFWKESLLPVSSSRHGSILHRTCVCWLCCMAKSYNLAQMGSAADPACISPSAIDCSSHFRGNWSTCYLDTGRLEIEIHFSIKLSCALSFVLEGLCVWPGLLYSTRRSIGATAAGVRLSSIESLLYMSTLNVLAQLSHSVFSVVF